MRSMLAPVVPMKLAISAPKASHAVLTAGLAPNITADVNAATDDVQTEKQDDEGNVLLQDRMIERRANSVPAKHDPNIGQCGESAQHRHKESAEIAVPPSSRCGDEWQQSNGAENEGKWDCANDPCVRRLMRIIGMRCMLGREQAPRQCECHGRTSRDADSPRQNSWPMWAV